jgi:hypothetical protein
VWAREGVHIEWIDNGSAVQLREVDAWIVAAHGQPVAKDPTAMGAVYFADGVPRPVIRVSIDSVIGWLARTQFTVGGLRSPLASRQALRLDPVRRGAARALGYVAAHELGHLWLGTRSHAATELMKATFDSLARLDSDRERTMLDERGRQRLAERLTSAANCR